MNWKHDQLQEDLASHLRGSRDRIVWTNMQLGPSGSPRPDVYTVPKTYSRFTPLAYECKISVSDFRRDITSGKWQSYLKYAAGVVFAVPSGLVRKEDIPPGCGLIVRHDEVWRTVKGPTLSVIQTLPHEAWMKLMIDGLDRQTHEPQPRLASPWAAQTKIRKKYGDRIGDALRNLDNAEARLNLAKEIALKSVEAINEEEQARKAEAKKRLEREMYEIEGTKREFCKMLGLPDHASAYLIRNTAMDIAERLSRDGEIRRLNATLQQVEAALAKGLKPLPTFEVPA